MAEKIIKNCCKFCVEQGVNCLGCAVAAGVADNAKFETFCCVCIKEGECKIDFKNMKDRNVCWILSDEDRETYRKVNPEYDIKLKDNEKKAEEAQADAIDDAEAEKMEAILALRKKRLAEKKIKEKDGKTTS
jgi:hypothetical protein